MERASKSILLAGLLAGTLDALAAVVQLEVTTGRDFHVVFQYIANAVFGQAAYSGGTPLVLWGVALHFLITCFWALLFYVLYPRLRVLSPSTLTLGLAYGIVVWLAMNFVVLPLTDLPRALHTTNSVLLGLLIHALCIGVPIAFVMRHYVGANLTSARVRPGAGR